MLLYVFRVFLCRIHLHRSLGKATAHRDNRHVSPSLFLPLTGPFSLSFGGGYSIFSFCNFMSLAPVPPPGPEVLAKITHYRMCGENSRCDFFQPSSSIFWLHLTVLLWTLHPPRVPCCRDSVSGRWSACWSAVPGPGVRWLDWVMPSGGVWESTFEVISSLSSLSKGTRDPETCARICYLEGEEAASSWSTWAGPRKKRNKDAFQVWKISSEDSGSVLEESWNPAKEMMSRTSTPVLRKRLKEMTLDSCRCG